VPALTCLRFLIRAVVAAVHQPAPLSEDLVGDFVFGSIAGVATAWRHQQARRVETSAQAPQASSDG
jgi:hypothetical protein